MSKGSPVVRFRLPAPAHGALEKLAATAGVSAHEMARRCVLDRISVPAQEMGHASETQATLEEENKGDGQGPGAAPSPISSSSADSGRDLCPCYELDENGDAGTLECPVHGAQSSEGEGNQEHLSSAQAAPLAGPETAAGEEDVEKGPLVHGPLAPERARAPEGSSSAAAENHLARMARLRREWYEIEAQSPALRREIGSFDEYVRRQS